MMPCSASAFFEDQSPQSRTHGPRWPACEEHLALAHNIQIPEQQTTLPVNHRLSSDHQINGPGPIDQIR